MRAVGHSLGAMSLLMYAVGCARQGRPHRIHRLILLTPAGFHLKIPLVAWLIVTFLPPLSRLLLLLLRGPWGNMAAGLYLPTFAARMLTFKLVQVSPMTACVRLSVFGCVCVHMFS